MGVCGPSGCWFVGAALKIVLDVVVFRLRKLEMANLAGAVAIMLALKLPPTDLLVRTVFAALLNILVYLNNDYLDVSVDAEAPDKDQAKVHYLRRHMRAAAGAQLGMLALLVAIALAFAPGLLVPLVLGGGICWAYSSVFKRHPFVDVVAMAVWGVAMPLCGVPLDSALGLLLALQLGLMSSVFESIQVMRDHDADHALGLRTTATTIGVGRTGMLARVLMVVSSLYGALVLHPVAGAIGALAVLVPHRPQQTETYWNRVKLVFGISWVAACVGVYAADGTQGLLWQVSRSGGAGLSSALH